ncbi:MAG: hypothetical protein J5487_09360 [Lachnospiraceae bacterium]|nr:hypothetical protein [Lachnospiraceae bacterium]
MKLIKNQKLVNAVKFIAFVILLSIIVLSVYNVLKWKDTTDDYCSSIEQLYNTDKNLIDVVFVGSSHVYCGIYPSILWEKSGIAAFDMSVSGQDKYSAYYQIKELLKTQSPKAVFVDIYGLFSDKHDSEGNLYRNLLSMKTSKNSIDLVNEYFKDNEGDKSNFYYRWPIIHTRYKELSRYDFCNNKLNSILRGERIGFNTGSDISPILQFDFDPAELSDKNIEWLNSLYDLSVQEGFKLVLMKTPINGGPYFQSIMDAASQYADSKNIDFIDFNRLAENLNLDTGSDFIDGNHVNAYGAAKVTGYLNEYINTNFDLKDHRGDSRYHQWDEDSKYYNHEEFLNNLQYINDIHDLHEALSGEMGADFSAIISIENTDSIINLSHDTCEKLSEFGLSYTDITSGGKWMYSGNILSKLIDNNASEGIKSVDLSKFDSLSVRFSGDGADGNVLISNNDYSNKDVYVNIVIYDNYLYETVMQKKY